jgi:hypothetical protein
LENVKAGNLEFAHTEKAPDATLWIKDLVVKVELPGSTETVAGKELFRFEAAQLPEFRFKNSDKKTISGAKPSFPPGVNLTSWKAETDAEFWKGVAAGKPFVGMEHSNETASAQLCVELEKNAGVTLEAGNIYHAIITYRTEGSAIGSFYYQFADYSQTGSYSDLPNTNGEWVTVTKSFTRPDNPIRLLVDNKGTGTGNILQVHSVVLTTDGPDTAANAPVSNKPALYEFDSSKIPDFRYKRVAGKVTGTQPVLPVGIHLGHWRDETDFEFWKGQLDGLPYLGIQHLNDTLSAKIVLELESQTDVRLQKDKTYTVELTYRTQGRGTGAFYYQLSDISKTDGKVQIPNHSDGWKTIRINFVRPSTAIRLLLDSTSGKEGNGILISKFILREAD